MVFRSLPTSETLTNELTPWKIDSLLIWLPENKGLRTFQAKLVGAPRGGSNFSYYQNRRIWAKVTQCEYVKVTYFENIFSSSGP